MFAQEMKGKIKKLLRNSLNTIGWDLTKNLKYDRLTKKIVKKVLSNNSCAIDIGCHKGEMLDEILKHAPTGKHFAFEPIPDLYEALKSNNQYNNVSFFNYALSDKNGETKFHYVKNAPAYSGIKKRTYKVAQPEIQELEVEMKKLDDIIGEKHKIDFIKIDVEGGEFDVLKGAANTIKKHKPVIIFEFGLGASDFYNTNPEQMFELLVDNYGLQIYTLSDWLNHNEPLTKEIFSTYYINQKEYYFIAN